MTTREEVEALAKWHEHQLTFVPDGDNALSKHHTNAAALLRSLLAERDEAIKHCEAMESWTTYEEWGRAADAFRKWMEGRK